MKYVYRRTEFDPYELYTVGYYSPDGAWQPESDHDTKEEAAARVVFLNGGFKPRIVYIVKDVHNGIISGVYTNMQLAINDYSKHKRPGESENYIDPAGKFALIGDRWQVDKWEVKS